MATISATITNDDGSITNLTGTVTETITPAPAIEPVPPSTALVVNMLLSKAWSCKHDLGTPGDASGTYAYPTTAPDGTPNCAELAFTNIAKGGALYHANVLADATPYNTFCLEVEEFYPTPLGASNLACMENDLEQVQSAASAATTNAAYVDMATQLDHYNGTVDITQNQKWVATLVKVDPLQRKAGVWYTTRIYVRNNGNGSVTYIGIYLSDTNTYYPLNITVQSQPSALWGQKLLNQQKQFVGLSAGTVASVVYVKVLNTHCYKT